MTYVECGNCLGLTDLDDHEDMIHRNFDDPDLVQFTVRCETCGATTVIGQIHADDYEYGGIDTECPYLLMQVYQEMPGTNGQGFFSPLSL